MKWSTSADTGVVAAVCREHGVAMASSSRAAAAADLTADDLGFNEATVIGRVTGAPESRTLPSGDIVVSFRVVVPRTPRRGQPKRSSVDTLECEAWTSAARTSASRWEVGDIVMVSGAVRRRFFRAATGPGSRVSIEMARGRRLAR